MKEGFQNGLGFAGIATLVFFMLFLNMYFHDMIFTPTCYHGNVLVLDQTIQDRTKDAYCLPSSSLTDEFSYDEKYDVYRKVSKGKVI